MGRDISLGWLDAEESTNTNLLSRWSRRRYRLFSPPHNYRVQRRHELEGPTSRHR
jgi:hypothetical protein